MAVRKDTVQLEVIINGQKAGSTLKDMRGNIRDLKRELDKLTVGSAEYNAKAAEISKATASLNNHTKAIKDQTAALETGGKKVNVFTDALKKGAVAALGFFSVQKVIQWGREVVSWALKGTAALEAQQRKTAIVFGDAIDIVEDFAKVNAQALGVTETKYASLAAQIGDILIPMGFQREEAAKMSSELTNLSGALSEWSNGQRSAEDVSKILAKALTGERESLKELGIVILDADVKARLLANGTDKLTGAALQQAKAQANLQLIMEKSKDAQTSFALNQDSIARSGNRFSAAMEQIKENILKGLQPAFKLFGNTLADVVAPLKRQSDLTGELQAQFNVQIETLKRGNISQDNRRKLIEQINTKYKEYLPNLITEKTSLAEISAIQDDVNKKFTQRILLLATEESLRDVSKELIKAKTEELDIAQKQIEAEIELAKFDINKVGKGREGQDQAFIKAATAAQGYTDALEANKKKQDELQGQFEETAKAAQQLGLDLNAILNPDTPIINPDDDPTDPDKKLKSALQRIEDLYNRERQLKIKSIEFLRENEEAYAAERARINLEADIKIATAQAQLYKDGTTDNLKLLQDALDKEAELRKDALELTFSQREEQINRESELIKLAIREEITDKEELTRKLEIEELEAQQRIATVRLAGLKEADAEYIALYNQITDRQVEIERQKQADQLAINEETIELQRELTLAGIDQLKLDEEDLQKYRQRMNLEYDKKILEARLKTFNPDSVDGVKTKNAIAEIDRQLAQQGSGFLVDDNVANSGGSSTPADKEKKRDKLQEAADAAIGVASNTASTLLDIERTRIDQQLQSELNSIETLADAKRRAAGDDAVELAKIDAQAIAAREKAEKKAAQDRKKLARKEAIIQGALAVVEALPNPFAVVAAGIATALQLAVIDDQSFFYGGPTGSKGIYRDKSGKNVAGVVHTNEYVVPEHITQDPRHQPVISYLENVRRAKGGFADGGFTNVSTRPASYVQTVTSTNTSNEMAEIRDTLRSIERLVGAWPREVKARVVYTELEKVGEDLNYIRGQANA